MLIILQVLVFVNHLYKIIRFSSKTQKSTFHIYKFCTESQQILPYCLYSENFFTPHSNTNNQMNKPNNNHTTNSVKGAVFMDTYDKKGKKIKKHYPEEQRRIWNCNNGNGIASDVLGSYSGTDENDDYPVQDADDL